MKPKRIQLARTKGYRKPRSAVVVSRPSKWGNPYRAGFIDVDGVTPMTPARAVERYRYLVSVQEQADEIKRELRGKDLACWCRAGEPCHADVLLEIANR